MLKIIIQSLPLNVQNLLDVLNSTNAKMLITNKKVKARYVQAFDIYLIQLQTTQQKNQTVTDQLRCYEFLYLVSNFYGFPALFRKYFRKLVYILECIGSGSKLKSTRGTLLLLLLNKTRLNQELILKPGNKFFEFELRR